MKRRTGSPPLCLASSVTEKTLVANSEDRLHSILVTLEGCRAALLDSSDRETALLVSVAILELRMKLNRIEDAELKALCDAMLPDEALEQTSQEPKSPQRRRPLLKLVKYRHDSLTGMQAKVLAEPGPLRTAAIAAG